MLKSYNFWIRLVAVLVLLLRIVGAELGFDVDSGLIIDLATAIASVLVVLGVIQVPVQKVEFSSGDDKLNQNENGGVFVKTFEQIKSDLILVKEKIASSVFGEDSVKGEISAIIDGIIFDGEETPLDANSDAVEQTAVVDEAIVIEQETDAKEVAVEVEDSKIFEGNFVQEETILVGENLSAEEEVVAGNLQTEESVINAKTDVEKIEEISENETVEFAEKIVGDALEVVDEFITEEEKARVDMDKLNTIVREKIATLLANEIDNILRDATI